MLIIHAAEEDRIDGFVEWVEGWGGLLYNNKRFGRGGGVFIQRVGFSLYENINTDELCL